MALIENEKCGRLCILEHAAEDFKFKPSAQDICEYYLKLKIEGKNLPCTHLIVDKNLYGDDSTPWEILKSDDPCWSLVESSNKDDDNKKKKKTKKVIYVFTVLKKKGERVLRKAGCGTWTGQNKKEVKNEGGEGDRIGFDRLLTFKIDDDKKMMNGDHEKWTMHEYTFSPNDYDCAICKITKESLEEEFPSNKKQQHTSLLA